MFPALSPGRKLLETIGATIADADFGGATIRDCGLGFSAIVPTPASPVDGVLFERGGSGIGIPLGLSDGGNVFRYRDGQIISQTAAYAGWSLLIVIVSTLRARIVLLKGARPRPIAT